MLCYPSQRRNVFTPSLIHSLSVTFFAPSCEIFSARECVAYFLGGARYEWQFYVSLFQPEATLVAEKRGGLISFGKGIIFKKIKLLLIYKIY